jgi:hypothetical protein
VLQLPRGFQPHTRWEALEPYTARSITARLAKVLDRAATPRLGAGLI